MSDGNLGRATADSGDKDRVQPDAKRDLHRLAQQDGGGQQKPDSPATVQGDQHKPGILEQLLDRFGIQLPTDRGKSPLQDQVLALREPAFSLHPADRQEAQAEIDRAEKHSIRPYVFDDVGNVDWHIFARESGAIEVNCALTDDGRLHVLPTEVAVKNDEGKIEVIKTTVAMLAGDVNVSIHDLASFRIVYLADKPYLIHESHNIRFPSRVPGELLYGISTNRSFAVDRVFAEEGIHLLEKEDIAAMLRDGRNPFRNPDSSIACEAQQRIGRGQESMSPQDERFMPIIINDPSTVHWEEILSKDDRGNFEPIRLVLTTKGLLLGWKANVPEQASTVTIARGEPIQDAVDVTFFRDRDGNLSIRKMNVGDPDYQVPYQLRGHFIRNRLGIPLTADVLISAIDHAQKERHASDFPGDPTYTPVIDNPMIAQRMIVGLRVIHEWIELEEIPPIAELGSDAFKKIISERIKQSNEITPENITLTLICKPDGRIVVAPSQWRDSQGQRVRLTHFVVSEYDRLMGLPEAERRAEVAEYHRLLARSQAELLAAVAEKNPLYIAADLTAQFNKEGQIEELLHFANDSGHYRPYYLDLVKAVIQMEYGYNIPLPGDLDALQELFNRLVL